MKHTLIFSLISLFLINLSQAFADDMFPGCTLQSRVDDRSEGRFIYKEHGNHFRNNAVILAPRCYYVASRRTSPIIVDLFTSDGVSRIERAKLKSTGFCPGNRECLGASTYLTAHNGRFYTRQFGSILVKIRPTRDGPRCDCSYYSISNPSTRAAFRAPVVESR